MFGNKELRERVRLLEYENDILHYRLNDLLNQLEDKVELLPELRDTTIYIVRGGKEPLDYKELKAKYG